MGLFKDVCMRFIKYIISFLFMALLSANVLATGSGAYAGLQVGTTNLNNDSGTVLTGVPNPLIVEQVEPNNKGIGERIFFGVQMNRYAGFEIGASNYAPSVYDTGVTDSNEPTIRVYAIDIVGKGMYSLYNFTLFGKIGGAGVRETASSALISAPEQVLKGYTSAHVMVAVGASFDLNANWVLDLTASRIFKGANFPNADFVGLGISYHWVDLYCGQFLC